MPFRPLLFALFALVAATAQAATLPVTDAASLTAARQTAACGDVIEVDGAALPVVPFFSITNSAACPAGVTRTILPKAGTLPSLSGVLFTSNGWSRTDARFRNANGWTLTGFKAAPAALPSTVGGGFAGKHLGVVVLAADNITIDGLDMRYADCSRTAVLARKAVAAKAVTVRNSLNVTVSNNKICGTWAGIDFLANDGLQILGNQVDDVFTDPIKGWSHRLTISGNSMERQWVIPDANGVLQHPDCIQLWTTNVDVVVDGVAITDNYCARGSADAAGFQGLNLRNEGGKGYTNVYIARNAMIGGDYANCITIGGAVDPVVEDNACYSSQGAQVSKIMLRNGFRGTLLRNRANLIQLYLMQDKAVVMPTEGPDANVKVPVSRYSADFSGQIQREGNLSPAALQKVQ